MDKSIVIIIKMVQALLAAALDLSRGDSTDASARVEDIWSVGRSELARAEANDRRRRRKKGG